MDTKRVIPIWVSVIYTVLCVAAIAFEIVGLFLNKTGAIGYVTFAFEIITTVLAACYCFTGYKKSSAVFYKAVILSLMVVTVLILAHMVTLQLYFQFFAELIIFGCLSVFAVAKDIGEKRSFILALLIMVSSVVSFVYFICMFGISIYICSYITSFLISVIVLIMVYAKYADKAARGTK